MAFFELTHPTRIIPDFPLANIVLAAFTGVVLIIDHRNVRLPRVPWTVVTYLALCTASVLWSINRSDTLHLTLLYAWIALFAAICVAQTDTQTLLRGIAWGGVLVVVVTLISVVVDPKRFGSGLLFPGIGPGVHGTKGVVAYSVVLALTAALMRKPLGRRSWIDIIFTLAVLAVGLIVASASTGRMGAACVLAGWLVVRLLRPLRGRALVRGWLIVGVGTAAIAITAVIARDWITARLGEKSDFNGRYAIWRAVIDGWLEAPVGGHGFGAVWFYGWWRLDGSPVLDRMNAAAHLDFFHGHNIFLDILPQLGVLGLVVAILIIGVLAYRGAAGLPGSSSAPGWALLVLVAVLVMGVAEPMLSVPVGWFSIVAATTASGRRHRARMNPGASAAPVANPGHDRLRREMPSSTPNGRKTP
ncbi:MAG TPA: O-antigen ligase family protein [Propionicimonas sp.]